MAALTLNISATVEAEISRLARCSGLGSPASMPEMAQALLEAHLILLRDCGDVVPAADYSARLPSDPRATFRTIRDGRGVTLSGGHVVSDPLGDALSLSDLLTNKGESSE